MEMALEEAYLAARCGEVPVGAVVVRDGQVLARGRNCRESHRTVLGHAEMIALHRACRRERDWRLTGAWVYVTLEPCPMCIGAMLQARIGRVVYGADDRKGGCTGSIVDLADYPGMPHHLEVVRGVEAEACQRVLSEFFLPRRSGEECDGTPVLDTERWLRG